MGCKTFPEQIAEANSVTTLQGSDEFGIVRNTELKAITFDDVVTQLGVTGTLSDGAAAGATPVLASAVSNNYTIRGITGGRGSAIALDGNDNIEIRTQVANAGTASDGEGLIKSATASTIEWRRIQSGPGIGVSTDGDSIIIENTDVSNVSSTVIVNDINDFPTAVAGVITLEADKDYLITNDITTNNRFVLPNGSPCVIRSSDRRIVTLSYTGTGNMFTYTNPQVTMKNIDLQCANGTLFAPSSNTTGSIELFKISITADTLGSLDTLSVFAAQSVTYTLITTNGWSFANAIGAAQFVSNFVVSVLAGTVVNLGTATFNRFGMSEFIISSSAGGTTFLSGAAASANINSTSIAIVDQAITLGSITPLSTITVDDAQWQFANCNGIADTRTDALGYLSSAQTTVISVAGTAVVLNGNSAFIEEISSQMTVNNNGRITYNGVKDAKLPITARVSAAPASGGAQKIGVYIAKNGTIISASEAYATTSAGSDASITCIWQDTAGQNDYYEVWVENDTSTNDIVVSKCVFRIN